MTLSRSAFHLMNNKLSVMPIYIVRAMKNLKGIKQGVRGGLGGGEGRVLSPSVVWSAIQVSYFVISESCMFFVLFSDLLRAIRLLQIKVFRYSFSEPIPIFFNRLKNVFFLVQSL